MRLAQWRGVFTSDHRATSLLALIITVGLATTLMLPAPAWWVALVVIVGIGGLGADQVIYRSWRHSRLGRDARRRYHVTLWILPALVIVAAALFLRLPAFAEPRLALGAAVITGLIFAAVVLAQAYSQSDSGLWHARARLALNLLAYGCGVALYAAIYAPRVRSVISATAIAVVTLLIAFELLRGAQPHLGRSLRWAAVIGLVVGEGTWALNYWTLPPLVGGGFLWLMLYASVGIGQASMSGNLTRRVVGEYAVVVAVGAAVLTVGTGVLAAAT